MKEATMLYEIINPSDPYTLRADDLRTAAVACVLLGRGHYALNPLEAGGEVVPLMLLGTADEWFLSHFGKSAEETVVEVMRDPEAAGRLAECLESCLIGKPKDRAEAELRVLVGEESRLKRYDELRSSLNDIGRRAYAMAKRLRDGMGTKSVIRAPQQVFGG